MRNYEGRQYVAQRPNLLPVLDWNACARCTDNMRKTSRGMLQNKRSKSHLHLGMGDLRDALREIAYENMKRIDTQ